MIGTGFLFAAGVGAVASVFFGLDWLFTGGGRESIQMVVASALWAFLIGTVFSGFLAITARGRSFDQLSLPRFAALGAGGGIFLFGVLALNAWDSWSVSAAIANATIFVLFGSGSATATLLLARRAGAELQSGDESPSLREG
jgi:hypothetical protein